MCFSTFLPLLWHVLWPVNWSLVKTWSFYQLSTQTGGLLVNLPLLKMLSTSCAQWVAPAHIPHLSTRPCDGSRTAQGNLALATSPANNLEMKRDAINPTGCQHIQSMWKFLSFLLFLLVFESCFSVKNALLYCIAVLYEHLNWINKYWSPCFDVQRYFRAELLAEISSLVELSIDRWSQI